MSTHTTQHEHSASAREAGEEAKAVAQDTARQAKDQIDQHATQAKEGVADEVHDVARALRKAADEMREGSPQERTMAQIADGLADASNALRRKDLGQMADDLTSFARGNPAAFLGGCALVGFAAARFARASSAPPEPTGPRIPASRPASHAAVGPAPQSYPNLGETP
jgi:hypothetical protein